MILNPVVGPSRITQSYGEREEYYQAMSNGYWFSHPGVDFAGENPGDKPGIRASYDCRCRKRNDQDPHGYGLMVELETMPDFKGEVRVLRYAHLDYCKLHEGDLVSIGDEFAIMGTTGNSTGVHLHLEMWREKDGKRLNESNGNHGRLDFEPYLLTC